MGILDFLKRKKNFKKIALDDCVNMGLLTKEEKLRIEKDRAFDKWQEEILKLKKGKKSL